MLPLTQVSAHNSPKTSSQAALNIDYDFLVIGAGDESYGDAAVGPRVAMAVADWKLPTVKAMAVSQLIPELSDNLVKTNYVMFVEACDRKAVRTIQIAPIVTFEQQVSSMAFAAQNYDPLSLLHLTQRRHNRHPQAWLLQIPIESCEANCELSPKAYQGCDQALRAIQQFLITYRQPYLCMKSA
ncbi:MAG: hydrogenase maturation protease [Cyanobacteria bacterium P01_D01_bin.156]